MTVFFPLQILHKVSLDKRCELGELNSNEFLFGRVDDELE
jgi:hypothetical protein